MKQFITISIISFALLSACSNKSEVDTNSKTADDIEDHVQPKTQDIDEAFQAVHSAETESMISKLDHKIKGVSEGDSRKAIITASKSGLKTLGSLSSSNIVEMETNAGKKRIVLESSSSLSNSKTRFVLFLDEGDGAGNYNIVGDSFYSYTSKKDDVAVEYNSGTSFMEGTVALQEDSDKILKGTSIFTMPTVTVKENGELKETKENVEMEVGFYNANL